MRLPASLEIISISAMTMKNEFVPYDIALAMKELGFDEPCFGQYFKFTNNTNDFEFRLFRDCEWKDRTSKWWNENISEDNEELYISAPLYQQCFRWFDYSTEWSGFIVPSKEEGCFEWWIQNYEDPNYLTIESDDWYIGREEAQDACLRKLIEICKK